MRYEHFDRILFESHRKIFYISTRGYAYSIDKFHGTRTDFSMMLKKGKPRVPVKIPGHQNPYLKYAVLFAKTGEWLDGNKYNVIPIDGNEMNCNIENLKIVDRAEVSKKTGPMSRSKAVIVTAYGKSTEYRSVREAAKALYCSYQTLLDYLSGKTPYRSTLKKQGRKIEYMEARQ